MKDQDVTALLDCAARAMGWIDYPTDSIEHGTYWHTDKSKAPFDRRFRKYEWEPHKDDGQCLRLAHALSINIDMQEGCAWIRLPDLELLQCFWGVDYGNNYRLAVVHIAAEIWDYGYGKQ